MEEETAAHTPEAEEAPTTLAADTATTMGAMTPLVATDPSDSARAGADASGLGTGTAASPATANMASMTTLTRFGTAFLSLPDELRTHILTYCSPDDLGVLSRVVEPLTGIETDTYLWMIWIRRTAPSRVNHALFSPLHLRPDALELVRRGTLRGVGIVTAVRSGAYWSGPDAVRISRAHETVLRATLRRALNVALAERPSRPALIAAGILPRAAKRHDASPVICARAHELDTALARCIVRRALRDKIGRAAADVLPAHVAWSGDAGSCERVRLALCPGIRAKRRFFEDLAHSG